MSNVNLKPVLTPVTDEPVKKVKAVGRQSMKQIIGRKVIKPVLSPPVFPADLVDFTKKHFWMFGIKKVL